MTLVHRSCVYDVLWFVVYHLVVRWPVDIKRYRHDHFRRRVSGKKKGNVRRLP